jgi:hypothetical protein
MQVTERPKRIQNYFLHSEKNIIRPDQLLCRRLTGQMPG